MSNQWYAAIHVAGTFIDFTTQFHWETHVKQVQATRWHDPKYNPRWANANGIIFGDAAGLTDTHLLERALEAATTWSFDTRLWDFSKSEVGGITVIRERVVSKRYAKIDGSGVWAGTEAPERWVEGTGLQLGVAVPYYGFEPMLYRDVELFNLACEFNIKVSKLATRAAGYLVEE